MSAVSLILGRKRLILSIAALLSVAGASAWLTMPRQEDPRLPDRFALVVAPFPGADAETVERLVVEPIEEHIAEVPEVRELRVTVRAGIGVLTLELREDVYDTQPVWDEVRRKLEHAAREFPAGVPLPSLDDDLLDQQSIVVAVTGSPRVLELVDAAERIKKRLLQVPGVKHVELVGDPLEQVTIEIEDATTRRYGLTATSIAAQLSGRNRVLAGGSLRIGARRNIIDPKTDFADVAELAATPIQLPAGGSLPLETLSRVSRGPRTPMEELFRLDGTRAVGVAVVPAAGIDIVRFGERLREVLDVQARAIAPLELRPVFFQPERVESRIRTLARSLLFGILIVAGLLIAVMGTRLGIVVATIIPLVAASALGIYALGGGVLHQISIAALVIALGMLVDNAIVVAENVQWRLDHGTAPVEAACDAVRDLALPLGSATGTTLAAFVPMLVAPGITADFTRSIPIVIMITLGMSYLFAVCVTPVLSGAVLRGRELPGGRTRIARVGQRLGGFAVRRPILVVAAAGLLVALSALGSLLVDRQFFPSADRNQVVLELELPEGTHIEATEKLADDVAERLLAHEEVVSVASFVGRAAPRFYYNIMDRPSAPQLAQLVAETRGLSDVPAVLDLARSIGRGRPEVTVVARKLEQGPPVAAPIEIMLLGDDYERLDRAARRVVAELRAIEGTADVRHDLGLGVPHLRFEVDDAAAARRGVSRADVARALFGRTLGLEIGQYRAGRDPVPIVLRSAAGENFPIDRLPTVDVHGPRGHATPLSQIATAGVEWRPAAIYRKDRSRVVTVLSQLQPGTTYSRVMERLDARLAGIELPAGVRVEYGGEASESADANAAILRGMPLGALLLIGFLLAEFNSFRRLAIILITIPLAATGVVPGLLVSGEPFGFMSLLGVIALVGIVVNNAIVLIDVVEKRRAAGASLEEALSEAVSMRTRPILLTTATTVAGLLPLALSPTTLWPPLAWAMISGLLASTVLTLVVVPALYALLFTPGRWTPGRLWLRRAAPVGAALGLALACLAVPARAEENLPSVSLEQSVRLALERPASAAAGLLADAGEERARVASRAAWLPSIAVGASANQRSEELELETPLGPFALGSGSYRSAAVELVQPLVDLGRQRFARRAARHEALAIRLGERRTRELLAAEAVSAVLAQLSIEASLEATRAYIASLEGRRDEARARFEAGAILESDLLKIELALARAVQERRALENRRDVSRRRLGVAIGRVGPHRAVEPGDLPSLTLPPPAAALESALEQRADLSSLEAGSRALELRADAVRAEALPRLEARARWVWDDSEQYTVDRWTEAALTLSWQPFASGTRAPRRAGLSAEARAARLEAEELRRTIALDLARARARRDTAKGQVDLARAGLRQAAETLRVEAARHAAERATTNDLLEAEANLRDERTRGALARYELIAAHVAWQLALGVDPAAWFLFDAAPRVVSPPSQG